MEVYTRYEPHNPRPHEITDSTRTHLCQDLLPDLRGRVQRASSRYGADFHDHISLQALKEVISDGYHARLFVEQEKVQHEKGTLEWYILHEWIPSSDVQVQVGLHSDTMTYHCMLMAITAVGPTTQLEAGKAMVQRLEEEGNIHLAVAMLLRLQLVKSAVTLYQIHKFALEAFVLESVRQGDTDGKHQSDKLLHDVDYNDLATYPWIGPFDGRSAAAVPSRGTAVDVGGAGTRGSRREIF